MGEIAANVKTPRYCYKIRQLTKGNKSGDAFGITIPRVIAKKHENTYFYVYEAGENALILESGCKPY